MSIKRIGIDTVFFERKYGGISRVWETLFKYIKSNTETIQDYNYEIILLLRANSQFMYISTDLSLETKFKIIQIQDFNYKNAHKDVDYLNFICSKHNIDVFISTYYTYCTNVPNILLIHDMIPEIFKYQLDPMWLQKKNAILNASHFITVSNQTKNDLINFYPHINTKTINNTPLYNIQTIYNSTHQFETINNSFILENNIKPKSYIFSIISNSDDYKNINLIMDFIKKYQQNLSDLLKSNISLIIILAKINLKNPILQQNALFMSNISDDLLASLYTNALCTVIPSLYEGFSLPVFESLLCKTPVISMNIPVYNELVPDILFTIENNIDSLYNKITEIYDTTINNPEEIADIIQKGYDKALEYTCELQAKSFNTYLETVVKWKPLQFINLIIQTYNETCSNRIEELVYCIRANLINPYVQCVFDMGNCTILPDDIKSHPKYILVYEQTNPVKWMTYKMVFDFANMNTSKYGSYWCIVNLDIFLDCHSNWLLTRGLLNSNYVFAQSRHEFTPGNDKIKPLFKLDENFNNIYHSHTQDAWLFKTPIQVNDCDFEFGMLGCDNAIAHRIIQSGYKVINKPITFKIYHNDNVKGKTSTNFMEKHANETLTKISKPENKHPEKTGYYLVPNYDKLMNDGSSSNLQNIDIHSVFTLFDINNYDIYAIISQLFNTRIKINN
jgi:glycosyltransferase involved in cell wall biosynthesis